MKFVIENWYLFAALVVILVMIAWSPLLRLIYGIRTSAVQSAVNLINRESAVIVDVCEPTEFQQGHLPRAMNIPLGNLAARVNELEKYRQQPILVTCRSGNRSIRGALTLRKNGFAQVYSLNGGLMAWEKEHLPVEK
ncbi:MAG: rhodanese-like domain-containing protein [Acidiferrobacteraceae bacterium]|jgi:rhodanese-related sulfurtransferase